MSCHPSFRAPEATDDPYLRGVRLLRDDNPAAAACAFRQSVEAEPDFALGYAALAVALAELAAGDTDGPDPLEVIASARRLGRGAARRDRQHLAIIELVLAGRLPRASALAREHLAEFPEDEVVLHAVARRCRDLDDLLS